MPLLVGTRRALLANTKRPDPFAVDTFTFGPAGTDLNTHTPEVGGTIAKHASSTGSIFSDGAGMIRGPLTNITGIYTYSAAPPGANYRVSADLYVASDNNTASIGVIGRADTATDTYYLLRGVANGDTWQLYKFVAGAATQLGSTAAAFTALATIAIALEMQGTTIRGLVNGAVILSATDSAITAAGLAGVRANGVAGDAVGLHLDNFAAVGF